MNVLITGASGLIGTRLIKSLEEIENINLYCTSRVKRVSKKIQWLIVDFEFIDWKKLNLPEFDVVYHLASQTSTYLAKEDPLLNHKVNVEGFLHLLTFLKFQKIKKAKIIFTGTVTQVGLPNDDIISESLTDNPITFYDVGKLCAELYLKQFVKEGWVYGCSLRLSNVYGGSLESQQKDRGIIDKVIQKVKNGEEIVIYGDGNFLRDYIHLEDVNSALLLAYDNMEKLNGEHFIIASGKSISLLEAFKVAIKIGSSLTQGSSDIRFSSVPDNISPIDLRSVRYSISKFKDITKWNPKFNVELGLNYSYGELN